MLRKIGINMAHLGFGVANLIEVLECVEVGKNVNNLSTIFSKCVEKYG
jgi:hypothetical protein